MASVANIEKPRVSVTPTPATPANDDLAHRLRNSDHQAFETLFRQFNDPLLRYAHRLLGDKTLAMDVLQDVFLKLWEKRESLEIKVSLNALLYTMARNRALNMIRQSTKYVRGDAEALLIRSVPAEHSAEAALSTRELDVFFRKCVNELPPRRAEAFILSRYHDLTHKEISMVMGLSKRTVDTHIVHALQHIRARYDALKARGIPS